MRAERVSDKIISLLEQGYEPGDIVRMGYARSTVYQVYNRWLKKKIYDTPLKRILSGLQGAILCYKIYPDLYECARFKISDDKEIKIEKFKVKILFHRGKEYIVELDEEK